MEEDGNHFYDEFSSILKDDELKYIIRAHDIFDDA